MTTQLLCNAIDNYLSGVQYSYNGGHENFSKKKIQVLFFCRLTTVHKVCNQIFIAL